MKNDAQKLLQDILFELSKKNLSEDPKAPEEYLQRLQKIYAGDFRHAYSSIFGAITRIDNSSRYDLDLLAENINLLHEYAKEKQNGAPEDEATLQFYQKIRKLYDHTNLDISRINYTKELAQRIEHENQTMTERLQKLQDKSEQSQKDYITILGIFSSIVVTFVAGLVFSGSVLNNIDKVSVYRLTFVMLMIAFFIFNLVALLLHFIQKIRRPEAADVFSKQASPIGDINTAILLLLLIDIIWWGIHWFCILHGYV